MSEVSPGARDLFDIMNWFRLHGIRFSIYLDPDDCVDHLRVVRDKHDFEIVDEYVRNEDYGGSAERRGMPVSRGEGGKFPAYVVLVDRMDTWDNSQKVKSSPKNAVVVKKGDNYMKIAHAVMGFDPEPAVRPCPVCSFRHAKESFL